MPSQKWLSVQPSSHVVQTHYVNARVHDINMNWAGRLGGDAIRELMVDLSPEIGGHDENVQRVYCESVYRALTRAMQAADLTINFQAGGWFSTENRYESYTQMYERAVGATGEMVLRDTAVNQAGDRVLIDDGVTFPEEWQYPSNEPARRGLAPGAIQPGNSIQSHMRAGQHVMARSAILRYGKPSDNLERIDMPDGKSGYRSLNKKFDPKTKQVFAALNYGRRPHGASIYYGSSCLILKNDLKVNALYFAGDTFFFSNGTQDQISYQTLGAIYAKAAGDMRRAILDSCLYGTRLQDMSREWAQLLEAHIFSPVRFATDVEALVLEPNSKPSVVKNAWRFCSKWGIRGPLSEVPKSAFVFDPPAKLMRIARAQPQTSVHVHVETEPPQVVRKPRYT